MARRPPSNPTYEKTWTPDSIRSAIRKLRRRLTDLESLDPDAIAARSDPRIDGLEKAIDGTLADVFGTGTDNYYRYSGAASLDTAGINMVYGTPHRAFVDGLKKGKGRSTELLRAAIRSLEERMEDDFPGEKLEADSPAVASVAPIRPVERLQTIAAIQVPNFTSDAQATVTDPPETRFADLQTRVVMLELALTELRSDIAARTTQIGIGHNQGPNFDPVPIDDLADVDDLIALLKEQGPTPPSDTTAIVAATEKAKRLSERITEGLLTIGSEMAKGGMREAGKELLASNWTAISHWIGEVARYVTGWLL